MFWKSVSKVLGLKMLDDIESLFPDKLKHELV